MHAGRPLDRVLEGLAERGAVVFRDRCALATNRDLLVCPPRGD